jgi:hypothetical protein
MIKTRYMHFEVELIHWLLLIIAAIVIVLAIATALGALDPIAKLLWS